MKIQAVAKSYWRSIKRGNRTFDSLSDVPVYGFPSMKEQILYLASQEAISNIITKDEFTAITGREYVLVTE